MSKISRQGWAWIMMLSISGASSAGELFKLECPEAIQVDERLVSEHPLWESATDTGYGQFGHRLHNNSLYYGHPKNRASMVPEDTTDKKGERKSTWKLLDNGTKEEYWVACSYNNTLQILVRRLPPHLKSCETSDTLLPSGSTLKIGAVVCR
jgi:hypothetical protein